VGYYGFDLFEGDRMAQVRRKLVDTGCRFDLFKGDTVVTLSKHVKALKKMDLIFIDGGHSYETVRSDWAQSKLLMHSETAVFFHNYDFSGVKRLVDSISREDYIVEIIHPSSDYDTAFVKHKV
jgi:predicted O-methyltransferase YrrM